MTATTAEQHHASPTSAAIAALRRLRIALHSYHLAPELVTDADGGPHLLIEDLPLAVCTDPGGARYFWPIGRPVSPRSRRPERELVSFWPAADVDAAARRISDQVTRLRLAQLDASRLPREGGVSAAAATCVPV
ncbi:hypothetical protein HS048_33955 [Planomonospora sp. ID91781]|uniref:hypothetical protein n=1 Tax=Planomonospora sp. ID91781 TaxID=2738135 RepID=UPI0018C36355|nr:hypothetical protein [Planomonospora sp. ID91781]MBG0825691.1 hypothetical protein [Planomonospora sp. ID91781]